MKALLLKKWGGNYAGQVLTNVERGSIPVGVAKFYEDDEPTPNDVVKDPTPEGEPLAVKDDVIDPEQVAAVDTAQRGKLDAAKKLAAADEKTATDDATESQKKAALGQAKKTKKTKK